MKIIKAGVAVPPKEEVSPWVGVCFVCPQCGVKAELEANDYPITGATGKTFVYCPEPTCDELIYLVSEPVKHAADFRGTNLTVN